MAQVYAATSQQGNPIHGSVHNNGTLLLGNNIHAGGDVNISMASVLLVLTRRC